MLMPYLVRKTSATCCGRMFCSSILLTSLVDLAFAWSSFSCLFHWN